MRKTLLWTIFSFFILTSPANGQQTILKGTNKTYQGFTINVYACYDYISLTQTLIGSGLVDSNGTFSINLAINQTCKVQVDLAANSGLLWVEPGKTYQINIPDYLPLNTGNRLNPYFKPTEFYLGVQNPDKYDINLLISQFDDIYNEYVEENYYAIFQKPRQTEIEKILENIENLFDTIPNSFFAAYRAYKFGEIKYLSFMRDNRFVIREYYNKGPFLYANPAYMELFNQLFVNYLSFYMNTREGERIYSDIDLAKSPTYAKQTLSNNIAIKNDTLKELILLKGINDAFYSNDFQASSLLVALDSIELTTKISVHKQIAQNIRKKAMQSKQGTNAPLFELYDKEGTLRKLSEYKANYVYLNFFSIESSACLQDLEQLKVLYEKDKEQLKVISISIDNNFEQVKSYFAAHGYNWILLSNKNNADISSLYRVKAYPAYFLIDTDGTLNMSPAPSPSENFEYRFYQLLKSRERKNGSK